MINGTKVIKIVSIMIECQGFN